MNTTHTIRVLINGQSHNLAQPANLLSAIELVQMQAPFAAAVNLQFVPKSQYQHTWLNEHDQIELIAPVTGG